MNKPNELKGCPLLAGLPPEDLRREFGGGRVGRVDVDFLSGPAPTGSFIEPSVALVGEKQHFGSSRRARWFGL
jgi:hypothetical protein